MNVLGISGRYREAAAALAIDGRVTAAASEDCFVRVAGIGYAQTGGFPGSAVNACLDKAGLSPSQVDRVVVVDEAGPNGEREASTADAPSAFGKGRPSAAPAEHIDAVHADALQAAASAEEAGTVLVCSAHPPAMIAFARDGGERLVVHRSFDGVDRLVSAARRLAITLGVPSDDPYRSLDRLSVGGEGDLQPEIAKSIRWDANAGVVVDNDALSKVIDAVSGGAGTLDDAASLNTRTQNARRSLAAGFICQMAHVVGAAADSIGAGGSPAGIALGGALAGNPRFNTELGRLGSRLFRASVPETVGRALGAALAGPTSDLPPGRRGIARALPDLALGPAFSDHDIKRTLDNCRLDYVYEPDWPRLLNRISVMLSQGKVVAWFQGAMAFGPRVLGSRSVLCDPSGRYARLNVNEYFRHVPIDEPLPVVFAPSTVQSCLAAPAAPAPAVVDAAVKDEWRDRLTAALDWRKQVRVQAVGADQAPELCDLLERHFERTGVPGLIETPLGRGDEPPACTPRDAVRTVYSSAIDALVIGRFLLMKDYWLLRSDGA